MDKKRLWKVITLLLFAFFGSSIITHEVSAKKTITVYTLEFPVKPGVYWYEQDSGQFRADTVLGPKLTNQSGKTNEPVKTEVRNEHDMRDYGIPNQFYDDKGEKYEKSEVSNIQLSSVRWDSEYVGKTFRPVNQWIAADGFTLHTITETGYGYTIKDKYAYNVATGKYLVSYLTPLVIIWKAEIEIPDEEIENCSGGGCNGCIGGDCGSGGGSCSFDIASGVGATKNREYLSANASGNLSSSTGQFDVEQGIPSSEYLKATASSDEYLFNQAFTQKKGDVNISNIRVTKTVTLTWKETTKGVNGAPDIVVEKSETEEVEAFVSGIKRPFSFWEVTSFAVWQVEKATMTNYALPNEVVVLPTTASVSASATQDTNINNHVIFPDCGDITLPAETISGGDSKPALPNIESQGKSEAEGRIGQVKVKNDSATFKGTEIMSSQVTEINGATPGDVPFPTQLVLTQDNLLIDAQKTNYFLSPSTGLFNYQSVFTIGTNPSPLLEVPFYVNPVTVHTPVVIYATATDDKEHDQRINPPFRSTPANSDTDRHAFILDRPFTVTLPTAGQHRNIPGYGNRDYSKYIKKKQVKFPFDV